MRIYGHWATSSNTVLCRSQYVLSVLKSGCDMFLHHLPGCTVNRLPFVTGHRLVDNQYFPSTETFAVVGCASAGFVGLSLRMTGDAFGVFVSLTCVA